MGLALLAWTVSEGTWGVLSRIVDGSIDWVNYGYAAAASYLLFLAIVLLTFLQFRLAREKS